MTRESKTFDPDSIDCDGFFRELRAIRLDVEAALGEHDVRQAETPRGIPYVQESVFARARKMVAVAVGRASMKRADAVGKKTTTGASASPEMV